MDEITFLQLEIENMPEMVLTALHMKYINQCMQFDLWMDITDRHCYVMREALGAELRTRMSAE